MTAIFDPSRKPGKQWRTPTAKEIAAHPCLGDESLIANHGCRPADAAADVIAEVQAEQVYEAPRPVIRDKNPAINELFARVEELERRMG